MNNPQQKMRHRSPNYPSLSLPRAIELAQKFYEFMKVSEVYADSAIQAWGMRSTSSSGKRSIGALLSYGLLLDRGKGKERKVWLSEIGKIILLTKGDADPERIAAIKEASLNPSIHRELHGAYPAGIPSDNELHNFLVRKGFNNESTKEVISIWRDTYSFANLSDDANMSSGDDDSPSDVASPKPDSGHSSSILAGNRQSPGGATERYNVGVSAPTRTLTVPISGGRMVVIEAPVHFSEGDYSMFRAVLEAMKSGLIYEPAQEPVGRSSDGPPQTTSGDDEKR